MERFITILEQRLVPKMNKITTNVYIQALQAAVMQALPMIFVGSIVTIITSIFTFFPSVKFPDLSPLNTFSFGLFGIYIAYLIPYYLLEKKRHNRTKTLAGLVSIGLLVMFIRPEFNETGAQIVFSRFGAEGMLCALIGGIYCGKMMDLFYHVSIFGKKSAIPEFVKGWFNNVIPLFVILFSGYFLIYVCNFDVFAFIVDLFQPMIQIGQSLPGFVLLNFVSIFFYSVGVSPWVLTPIIVGIMLPGIAENAELVAQGLAPTNINTQEVVYFGWLALGGLGTTLPLNLFMLFSKSKRVKSIGKAVIVPSIMNINEPLIFGTPIVFNPLLMFPMWIISIVISIIVYLWLQFGLAQIPSQPFFMMGVPLGITTWLVSPGIGSIVLLLIVFLVASAIWYPFYKVFEHQEMEKEKLEEAKGEEK